MRAFDTPRVTGISLPGGSARTRAENLRFDGILRFSWLSWVCDVCRRRIGCGTATLFDSRVFFRYTVLWTGPANLLSAVMEDVVQPASAHATEESRFCGCRPPQFDCW
ncbi:hypothetical protein Sfum_1270 [Syntrophobacter fumaroxidans MPOB]|uniref:Uncharacterized protein n=1 Tax=Syntrophobacter fumaroxidans (strain DSM 10017 / MPOB) TaxID=335543 RepID=A0LHR0_SYNFM|nr:hypothetical protein Sfum_1270 [Syntrophobacter fumaroxidans MPOB]